MGWVIAGAAVAVVAITLFFWVRWLSRRRVYWFERLTNAIPIHSDWWKAQRAKTGELLYVAIGDSAAQGIGASRPGRSYVGFVAAQIRSVSSRQLRVVNLGISGATVGIAIAKQLPALAKLQPDIVTVSIGANDMPSFEPSRFAAQLEELFTALPSHAIVADLPTFYFLPAEKKVRIANTILREAATKHGLAVVPLHEAMRKQGLWGVTTQFAGDLFHPNDRGYRVWAGAFHAAVDDRLRRID
jgi:lysophospholipase L1-like esterase